MFRKNRFCTIVMRTGLAIVLFFLPAATGENILPAQDLLTDHAALDRLQPEQIDSLQNYTGTLRGYRVASDYAFDILSKPGTDPERELKAEVLMLFLSSKIDEGIRSGRLSPCKDSVKYLIKEFRKRNMSFYHPVKSDGAKLIGYLEAGKFSYVYKRISGLKHFTLWVCILAIFFLFSLANVSGLIKWRYRKICNRAILVIVALGVLSLLFFYFYVKKYSSC